MARTAGYGGAVANTTGNIAGIKTWSIDYKADILEATAFDSAGVAAYISAITRWSGSFDGYKNSTALVTGTTYIFDFEQNATSTGWWYGTGIITNAKAKTDSHALITYAYDFTGTGILQAPTA